MMLAQMIQDIYADYGNRFQVTPEDILRFIGIVQRMAFAHDCPAFRETAALAYNAVFPLGPYSWPSAARNVVRVENANGLAVSATLQPIRRSAMLLADPMADLVWVYHIQPEELTSSGDDSKILVPAEWHRPLLVQGAVMLCDAANYGDEVTVPDLSNVLVPFWAAMDAAFVGDEPLRSVGAW